MEKIIKQIYQQAKQLGACSLFTGRERTVEDIVALFTSPKGLEFCIEHHFPNMATLRLFKPYGVERFGIYIDAGAITLTNPSRVILIGRTSATVECDTLDEHKVVLLHGASAVINASRWAVVGTTIERGCMVIKNATGHAIIL